MTPKKPAHRETLEDERADCIAHLGALMVKVVTDEASAHERLKAKELLARARELTKALRGHDR